MKSLFLHFVISSLAFPGIFTLRKCITIGLLTWAFTAHPQDIFVPQGYAGSYDSPIEVGPGLTLQTAVKGYFVNENRYQFYRKLHEFANDESFKGREKEILDGFGGFLTSSEEILENLTQNTSKIELSSASLKIAQNAVDSLANQVGVLRTTNLQLKEQLNTIEKTKPKKSGWVVPSVIGTLLGAIGGIVLGASL